jgi:hypothetical protein
MPQSPGDVTVCTPPSNSQIPPASDPNRLISTKRKHLEGPLPGSSSPKRQHTIPKEAQAMLHIAVVAHKGQQTNSMATRQIRPRVIDLEGLPYFQFQDVMRSQGRHDLRQDYEGTN